MPGASFETVKSLNFSALSGSYANVGSATTNKVRVVFATNLTDGDLMISIDGTNDHFPVAAGVSVLLDITSNMKASKEDGYFFPVGTQFSAKEITASSSKDLYITCLV